ncbi:MAG: methyltransferase domain-containing protein [Armatimonadota bacterium]|nr:methyltransferase domain-containing protein [Armatimonadota bacterium]MDW8156658.1 methyltransferase domain-containing protein [Armatimonadota bacterium]
MVEQERIRQAVRQRYARAAREGCCGCGLPVAAETGCGPSLGCGNPVAHAHLRPGEVVVDVGSGPGLEVIEAATLVGPRGRAVGIDITPEMVAAARGNAAARGVPNASFLLGDAESLPLPDDVADVVLSNCAINLVPDKLRAFCEAFRVLRPGGRLVLSDVVAQQPVPPELRQDLEAWSACVSGAVDLEDVLRMLRAAGFDATEVLEESPVRWGSAWGVQLRSVTVRARKPRREPRSRGSGC